MRILLIEEDQSLANVIAALLRTERFTVDLTTLGEDGLEIGKIYDYDLILLELTLPDINGYEVIKRLRISKIDTPILILSGFDDAEHKIRSLDLGADDYLTKPFHKSELLARIRAIVRRARNHSTSIIRVGKLSIDMNSKNVKIGGASVHLTGKEYEIVELLALRKGITVPKSTFLTHLYGGIDEPDIKIVDVFVCKIRAKFSKATRGEQLIETIWGRGYVLREPEEEVDISIIDMKTNASP